MKTANLAKVCLLPSAVSDLFACVIQQGQITLADQYGLIAALMNSSLSKEEEDAINRLLYGMQRGWLKVVDEV